MMPIEMTQSRRIILISVIVLIIIAALYIAFDRRSRKQTEDTSLVTGTQTATTTTTTIGGLQVGVEGAGQYTIKQVPVDEGTASAPQPIPDLSRPVLFGSGVSIDDSAKKIITDKVSGIQSDLKKNPAYLSGWIDLGLYQKMAGDYAGAIVSWTYAGKLSPDNFVSFGNLGNLYAYYLHDNGLAETYYLQAISKGPTQEYLYTQLAEVYRDVFKDIEKARAIVNQGLSKLPQSQNLLRLKASLE